MGRCCCSKTCAIIAEEEANDEGFSRQLAALCDGLFVCDAFGSAHRAHASVVGITRFVKQAAAGLLMERELSLSGEGAFESPSGRSWPCWAGQKCPTRSKWSKT